MSPFCSESDIGPTNKSDSSIFCAFLCDDYSGAITRDFGESISARSLVDLMGSCNFMSFLETVRSRGATPGWEMEIHYEGSASSLLLSGSLTPHGALVIATLTPYPASSDLQPSRASNRVTEPTACSKFSCPVRFAGVPCPALLRQYQETHLLMSAVVHNLKNPISSILSSCEYLEGYSQENLEPEQLELIHAIESAARTLLQVSGSIPQL
jgi:hypothetical protein